MLVVGAPMVWAQAEWSRDPRATPLGVLLVATFAIVAPVSYRVLFPDGLDFSHGAVRLLLYSLVGAGVMLSLCVGLPRVLGMRDTFLTDRTTVVITTALFLVGGWGLGRDIGMEQRLARLTAEAERAQLLALKSHLDPHFLFNTLNAIAEWCRIDGVVAERAVLSLSAMLRTMLDGVREPLWPLEREVELAHRLFELHLLRDRQLFTLEERVPQPLPMALVPPMCLLTLVENAVKHGPGRGHRGVIQFEVSLSADQVRVVVENPGPFTGRRVGGTGLPTLERHLKVAFADDARLDVQSAPGARTRATLTFPLQRSA